MAGRQHRAEDIASGVISPARLGTGTPDGTVFLRGDGVWGTPPGGPGGTPTWGSITGTLANQLDLQTALDGKVSITHSHVISQVTGLQAALDGKISITHSHAIAEIVGLQAALDGKISITHSHVIAEVVGLQATLDAKASVTHVHAAADITSGTMATVRLGSGTANSTTFLRGDQTWAAPAGGADPWTVIKLGANVTVSATVLADVTGMGFSLSANTTYMFEAVMMLRTAGGTSNPKIGWAWATGLTDGVVSVEQAQTATTQILAEGNINATVATGAGGLPNTTQSWPALLYGLVIAGATPSGQCRVVMASELAATAVTAVAGSYLRYRSY